MPEDRVESNDQQSAGADGSPEFGEFPDTIPNPNTRIVYARVVRQFLERYRSERIVLDRIEPSIIATSIEQIDERYVLRSTEPTLREHLNGIWELSLVVHRSIPRYDAGCLPRHARPKDAWRHTLATAAKVPKFAQVPPGSPGAPYR
jgi:hypothetical protein